METPSIMSNIAVSEETLASKVRGSNIGTEAALPVTTTTVSCRSDSHQSMKQSSATGLIKFDGDDMTRYAKVY
jgi:hypothetical protein